MQRVCARRLPIAVTALGLLLILTPATAGGTVTINPTRLDDPSASGTGSCPNDPCSLRQAVNFVNTSGGVVSLAPPAPQGSYSLTQGNIVLSNGVSIVGPGARAVTIAHAGGAADRVFDVRFGSGAGPNATISGVTISGGTGAGFGGGIYNEAGSTLVLSGIVLSGNDGLVGGGVANEGTLTISGSTIAANVGSERGGGAYIDNGTMVIADSTIAGNTAGSSSHDGFGGGVYRGSAGALTLANVTLAGNNATGISGMNGKGGNLYTLATSPIVGVSNTIISGGSASVAGTENCGGSAFPYVASTGGRNLEDRNQCGLGASDLVNTNPALGPLKDNGGSGDTRALNPRSAAINTGSSCVDASGSPLTQDERAVGRPQGPACDLGAFEFREPALAGNPQLTGTPQPGQTLDCNPPAVSSPDGQPAVGFVWLRDGSPIPGADASAYTLVADDAGHTLACQVVVTYAANAAQGSVTATSSGVVVPAPPAPLAPTPTPTPTPPVITVSSATTTILSGKTFIVRVGNSVTCPAGAGPCNVVVKATARVPATLASLAGSRKFKTVTIGASSFTVAAGTTKRVTFKLSKKGAALLRKLKKMLAKVSVTVRYGTAPDTRSTRTVLLKLPKAHARR